MYGTRSGSGPMRQDAPVPAIDSCFGVQKSFRAVLRHILVSMLLHKIAERARTAMEKYCAPRIASVGFIPVFGLDLESQILHRKYGVYQL